MTLRLRYSVRSHVGKVREGNEDSAYAGSRLAIVADGMGGHAAGEVASSAVVAALAQLDDDEAGLDLLEVLASAVQVANDHLRAMVDANASLDGMGTTLTALLSSGTRLGLAHVGDSRAYLLRDGEFSQLTHDQTLVQRMVDEGRITPEQAETHPQRSLLTQALDGRAGVQPDLSVREARRGDRYLLCSDGLSGYVAYGLLAETLAIPDADAAAERLIDLALAAGAPDNVTVVIADVVDDEPGMPDTPVVGGAAAEQDAVPSAAAALVLPGGASLTAEERAAKREARRSSTPPPPPPPPVSYGSDPQTPAMSEQRPVDTGVFRLPETGTADVLSARELAATPPAGMPPISGELTAEPGRVHRRSVRRRWYRRPVPLAVTTVLLVVVAGVLTTWAIAANSWYVAGSGGQAALFHGLQSKPLGVSLSSVAERGISLDKLNQFDRDHVSGGIVASSHADGVCILARLKFNVEDAAHQAAAKAAANEKAKQSPSPTPAPTPTVSVPPATPLPKSCSQ
ncbi:MAG TPA: protein phosphatase 2C domain-containing protein [Frankiaceae bacterium]|nr:protein phosphatase 2C domain-containing protein [Frankiaceae bacterium]